VREQVAQELLVRENLVASVEALDRELLLKGEELLVKDAALVEVNSKADYLFAELAGVREQVAQELLVKDASLLEASSKADVLSVELAGVWDELLVKDAALLEVNLKAEYLFAELAAVREQTTQELLTKNGELAYIKIGRIEDKKMIELLRSEGKQKMRQIESLDRELTQLAIKAVMYQESALRNEELIRQNKSLYDGLYWVVKDLNSITGRMRYSTFRKLRLLFSAISHFKIRGTSLRDDVLPYDSEPIAYIEGVIKCGFTAEEYLSTNKDVESKRINPFTHFLTVGEKENRRAR